MTMSECPNCQRLQAIIESRDRDLDAQDVALGYEVLQGREAKAYLTSLLAQYDPTCVPMDGLIGLCTQIDTVMTVREDKPMSPLNAPQAATLSVDPIHDGDEGEGPLESTDIFITGPGLSVLINVPATGEPVTYHGRLGAEAHSGTIPQTPSHNVPAEHAMIGATLDALAAGISVEDLRAAAEEQ